MAVKCVLVFCALVAAAACSDLLDTPELRLAVRVFDECSKADGFTPCLKKKAIAVLDRMGRMDKLSVTDGITVVRDGEAPAPGPALTEEQIENTLPRSLNDRDDALNSMLLDKVSGFVSSRTLQFTMPKIQDLGLEEGRGKKMKGMMGAMMMGVAAKTMALIPVAIAGLFLLAGKALITAKIALLLAGIIAIKKLLSSKGGGGGGGHGGGGWQSGGSGGGWDKRSIDDAQKLAYSSYAPQ